MNYLICGNYGATNIGDEAILAAIIDEIREKDANAHITAMSNNPKQTSKVHATASCYLLPAGFRSLLRGTFFNTIRAIRAADTVYVGGGGLFTDERLRAVFLWWWQCFWIRLFNRNMVMYKQSVGPLNTFIGRFFTKIAFRWAKKVIVRDELSKKALQILGISGVSIAKDPVLTWDYLKKLRVKTAQKPYIVLSLRPWHQLGIAQLQTIAKHIGKYCSQNGLDIVFIPFQTGHDDDRRIYREFKHYLPKNVQSSLFSFDYNKEFRQAIIPLTKVYLDAKSVIAMRLHALIFGHILGKKQVGIVYSTKVHSFLTDHATLGVRFRSLDKLTNIAKLVD